MIISASRRCDIPAYFSKWFENRIKSGYVLVPNPINPRLISKVKLSPKEVDAVVFWTKNPAPMLKSLDKIPFPFYFQISITPYGNDIERNLPSKSQVIIPAFKELSRIIGADRVIWRYDPILLTRRYTTDFHMKAFSSLAQSLAGYTKTCVISFIDMYKNTAKQLAPHGFVSLDDADVSQLAGFISKSAANSGIKVQTCCEAIDLDKYGISSGSCIDMTLLEKICGCALKIKKDKNQRKSCGCAESIDIGMYNACHNGCLYCYANYSLNQLDRLHDPASPILIGDVPDDAKIVERKMFSMRETQLEI